MSILEAVNFLEIQNGKDADRAARKLDDLKDEAAHLQQMGLRPISWYEFKQHVELKKPRYFRNALVGAGMGAALMGGLTAIAPVALLGGLAAVPYALGGGAFFGALAGSYHETENSQHHAKVAAYEHYLNQFKQAASQQALAHGMAQAPTIVLDGKPLPSTTVSPERIVANDMPEKGKDYGAER